MGGIFYATLILVNYKEEKRKEKKRMDTLKAFYKVALVLICFLLAVTLVSPVIAQTSGGTTIPPGHYNPDPPADPVTPVTPTASVPEANIMLLLGSGLISLFVLKRKF